MRVLDLNGGEISRTTTDAGGEFRFSSLADGTYRLEFEATGFKKLVMNNAQVRDGFSSRQDATLQVGEEVQTVTVSATAPTVESANAALASRGNTLGSGRGLGHGIGPGVGGGTGGGTGGGSFHSGIAQDMPLNGKNFENLLALRGGSTGGAFNALLQASTPSAAEGQDFDDLYEYKLKDRVTIRKNQSAMVPILQSEIRAEKISLWTADRSVGHPLRGGPQWLSNTSGETLDGGNFSVIEDEIFAGQGLLEPIKRDERRMLSYATDLGMLVRASGISSPQHNTRVSIAHGVMVRVSDEREKRIYTIRNEDSAPRMLIVEHPVRAGWHLAPDTLKPEETSATMYRFRVAIGPKQSTTLEISESHPVETKVEIDSVTDDQVALLVKENAIDPSIEQALRKILAQKAAVEELTAELGKRSDETTDIYDDQQRLRENLKALKGSTEEKALTQRYTQQLSERGISNLDQLRLERGDYAKESRRGAGTGEQRMIEELLDGRDVGADTGGFDGPPRNAASSIGFGLSLFMMSATAEKRQAENLSYLARIIRAA